MANLGFVQAVLAKHHRLETIDICFTVQSPKHQPTEDPVKASFLIP